MRLQASIVSLGGAEEERLDLLMNEISDVLEDNEADHDEAASALASLLSWTLHQLGCDLDDQLAAADVILDEVKRLLLRNASAVAR